MLDCAYFVPLPLRVSLLTHSAHVRAPSGSQYCYSNTFIYTQPGNGKVKIKEPKQQVAIAVQKIDEFLR